MTFAKNDRVVVTCRCGCPFFNRRGFITHKGTGWSVVSFDNSRDPGMTFPDSVLLLESECVAGHGPENVHITQELPP